MTALTGFRERRLEATGVEVERVGLDFHEERVGAEVSDDLSARREGVHRHRHAVARPDADRLEREVQAGRRRVHGERMLRADARGEFRLEAPRHGPGRDPAGAQALGDRGNLFFANRGLREGNEVRLVLLGHCFLA